MTSAAPSRASRTPFLAPALALLLVALAAIAPASALAKTKTVKLTEKATGLSVVAPKGYALAGTKAGTYRLTGGGLRATFSFARSALDATGSCRALATGLPGTRTETTATAARYVASVVRRKPLARAYVRCTQLADHVVQAVTIVPLKAAATMTTKRLRFKATAVPAAPTAKQLAAMEQLVTRHLGGTTFALQVPIPTKRFTSSDGKGSATVPDLPGWLCAGSQGGIDCGAVGQGYFQFGDIGGVSNDPRTGFAQSPAFVGPQQVVTDIYPQYAKIISGATITVPAVQLVTGTENSLGPNSGMYVASLVVNGAPYTAMFLIQSSDAGGLAPSAWYFYITVIAVQNDAPAGVAQAMFNAWGSWDPSGAIQARIAQTLETIRTTPIPQGGIDPGVFQVAANNWDSYIRGPKQDEQTGK